MKTDPAYQLLVETFDRAATRSGEVVLLLLKHPFPVVPSAFPFLCF